MVRTRVSGRMGAMEGLMDSGKYSQMEAVEVSHERLAAQSILRELLEADEANLLEEEDMHIFDCKPMVDLLHLVCCNNCKKPVKASQYAVHAERCRSMKFSEEIFLKLDGGIGHKKPPRKGRKKSQIGHANLAITTGDLERSGSMDGDYTVASESVAGDKRGLASSRKAKRKSAAVSIKDVSVVHPQRAAVAMSPSEKRPKIITAEHLLISEGLETANGVATSYDINDQKPSTYHPAPLATKMYHSQRNLRLRFAVNHLYQEASSKDHCSGSPKLEQESAIGPCQDSSPKDLLHDPKSTELLRKEKDADTLVTLREPDQILVNGSELCLGNSRAFTSAVDPSNQLKDNKFARTSISADTATVGKLRSRYRSTAYSYIGNSGTSLGKIQKPSGSVHVV